MTDQSKIPPPEKPADAGNRKRSPSLIERAEGLLDSARFKPAPMPHKLAEPQKKRGTGRPVETASQKHVGAPTPASAPAPAATASVTPASASTPPRRRHSELPPVYFSRDVHVVDRERLRAQGLIEPEGKVSRLLEEFRIVKRQLLIDARRMQKERKLPGGTAQRILVCSPHPGEGKTFCATNLALAMAAEKDCEVVLVDADFAKPSILSVLGLPRGAGLLDALANPAVKVEDCVLTTDIPGLHVLPAGNSSRADSEYLAASSSVDVLNRLTQGATDRIVIFDSPPALAASPAAELAKHSGQAVLVARADKTGQSALEDALSLLESCPNIRLMLNAAHFSPSGRRFGAYYGYEV
ncbi:AAA family ATPase [Altericroceibacterium endophyticum]|uniref:AAA family ATPase n=1 Tax=Altericroceibacterium endophyticum TaxID=1808508 RepID=A0A6I4T850_9SPHN|nr:AAA family ATPase [Altericroceibacterium endophyticum]MXO66030.1 AAA family ATPase [Altericroceibacterium endophyticum]